jgi:cell division protein ZapD
LSSIIYEQPLNERIRTLLRLESLFRNIKETINEPTAASSHATLDRLAEILILTDRSELKKDLMREMENHHFTLSEFKDHSGVDHNNLDDFMKRLKFLSSELDAERGKPGKDIRDIEFIKSFRQRSSIPGGLSDIDFPQYHYWLNLPAEERITSLTEWLSSFDIVSESTSLVLDMIRKSATPTTAVASKGFYQHSLDKDTPYQLIRVTLPIDSPYYVEISGGRHRFSVRMMLPNLVDRSQQATEDISFQLTTCIL